LPVTKASPNEKMLFKSDILPVQYKYFEKIINFTKQNNIKLIMVNMPMSATELKSFSPGRIAYFDKLFQSKTDNSSVFYLNFSQTGKFPIEDYMDYTHLNPAGADKFSVMLNDSLVKIVKQ
jgi:lysophospholipase L1-like esterase